ncbi:Pectate lyase superfamily protein [Paraburkholderia steynii]|uniref:Pectate lyase superfamily protein n=1 Tax=Paraburkholderia steynii TaxID=1245441 RepID=A0A7Z7FL53_9BURK|nr:glycosyl hydrolase family 28-related protein [Paraburkholderia steynii]SDI65473.1 Pectate lyase superfamily protein [Paraburkholderia steynii]
MTVPVQNPIISYAGNGITTLFTFPFEVLEVQDLNVLINGVAATFGSGYSINGLGNPNGGSVQFNAVPAAGAKIIIYRKVAIERTTDYQDNGDLLADTVNADFDRIWMALQDIDGQSTRAIQYPVTEFTLDGTLPGATDRANNVLGFDTNGFQTMVPMPASVGAGDLKNEIWNDGANYTAGTSTSVTLSRSYTSKANLGAVVMMGVTQDPDTYSIAGNQLQFNAVIPLGVSKIWCYGGTTISLNQTGVGTVGDEQVKSGSKLANRLTYEANVIDFGADPTGVGDCTTAVQNAISAALAIGMKRVYFPTGTYRFFAASPGLDPGVGNIEFCGDGRDASILIHEEGDALNTSPFESRKHLFVHISDTTMKGSVGFRDLQIKGTLAEGGYAERGGTSIALNYYRSVHIINCRFTNKSQMNTACEYILVVQVMNCEFDECLRDNARFRSSWNCLIVGNTFRHSDDDAVALHQANYVMGTGNIREGIVVADNTFEDTCGIHILGGRNVSVHDNLMRRVKQTVIDIDADANEGPNPMFGIRVHNNQIFDSLVRPPFSGPQFCAISVTQFPPAPDTNSANTIPMQNETSGPNIGLVTQFWPYRDASYASVATFGWPTSLAIDISNNTIMRTLPAVSAYSQWGFGKAFAVGGYSDAAVSDAALRMSAGIAVPADARNVNIGGNIIMHTGSAISYYAPTTNFAGRGNRVHDNVLYDFSFAGVLVNSPSSGINFAAEIYDNDFDGDPFHNSTGRGGSGTWTSASSGPAALVANGSAGITFRHNKVANVSQPINASNAGSFFIRDNHLVCSPAALGYSASNKGIGFLPNGGAQYWHEVSNCDPTSASYGTQFNPTLFESNAMPSSGTYVPGHFVRNFNSSLAVHGWQRLTLGNAHVAGTDWKTVALT